MLQASEKVSFNGVRWSQNKIALSPFLSYRCSGWCVYPIVFWDASCL